MSDFESLWKQAIAAHVRDMPANELNALVQQVRPEAAADAHLPVARRQSFGDKVSQLAKMADDAQGQGYQGGMSDAANARGGITYPQPEAPVEPAGPQPFQVNRAQSGSFDGPPPPVDPKSVNQQRISDILNNRRP